MFKFITDVAQAAVDLTCDSVDMATGGDATPKRSDAAKLLAAGMSVAAVVAATGLALDVVEEISDGLDD